MPDLSTSVGLWLHGSSGRMGREIQKAVVEGPPRFRLLGGSDHHFEGEQFYQGRPVTKELLGHILAKDDVQLVLDFSTVAANELLRTAIDDAKVDGLAVLVGTTGLPAAQLAAWRETARTRGLKLLIAPNTSIGVLMTVKAALLAAVPLARIGFDVEITETHHRAKRDAPSGTARFLAETLADAAGLKVTAARDGARAPGELGVHSVRGGGVFGEHQVRLLGDAEEISISHRAFSRSLFASGALVLAGWILRQPPGVYGLLDVKVEELLAP